jgi:thiamine biosynthesis lipoprotein
MTAAAHAERPDASTAKPSEHRQTFDCFGSQCTVIAADAARPADAAAAVAMAKRALLGWHDRFSRFEPDSELSQINRDPRSVLPISPLMRRVIEAALQGAQQTDGLVDPALGVAIQRAGYDAHMDGPGIRLGLALSLAPPRRPATGDPAARWRQAGVDASTGTLTRPPGLALDPGGIAKGVFADELASMLAGFDAFALDCAGDIRLGGTSQVAREVGVQSPFDNAALTTLLVSDGGVATSGIGRRSWLTADGRPAHHLLDPGSGRPAFTGVVQATALAPTATEAEILAKAALLSGPERAARWLRHGGVLVLEDGSHRLIGAAGPTATGLARRGCNRGGRDVRREPAADLVEHPFVLGLVEDLVIEPGIRTDRLVGGADPLAQHHAARRGAEAVIGAVGDQRRERDRAHGVREPLDRLRDLGNGARRELAVVDQRI